MSKVFIGVLVLILGVITGFSNLRIPYLNATPTPTPIPSPAVVPQSGTQEGTANWKTYTNTTYGFSVRYPPDNQVSNENSNGQSVYFVPIGYDKMDEQEKSSVSIININVLISDAQTPLTASSFVSSAKAPGYNNKRNILTKTVDGHSAIQFISNNTQAGSGNDEINTIIETNQINELILISESAQENTDPTMFPDHILSTFKFLDKRISSYTSQKAKIQLTFPQPMYVTETYSTQDGWERGDIVISSSDPSGNEGANNMTIVYGIPQIEGKGGSCLLPDGSNGYQKKTILGQLVSVCDIKPSLSAGYPKYPGGGIEYSFYISQKGITDSAYQIYKKILYNGLSFIK